MPIRLAGTYRCVVRDSHFHNSYSYGFAQDNYGIVLACGSADDLVENNIARFMNKPILFNNSGGGNVIGYNYADNSWSCDGNGDDGFQEVHHRLPLCVSAHGAHGGQLGAAHGRDDDPRQRRATSRISETTPRASGRRASPRRRSRRSCGASRSRPSTPTSRAWTSPAPT